MTEATATEGNVEPDTRPATAFGSSIAIALIIAIQGSCALFFVANILLSIFGLSVRPIPWALREYLEIGAALGLSLGTVLGAVVLYHSLHGRRDAEESLRRARSVFADQLAERFDHWGLTPAEADVAIFAIKGLRTAEIAELRQTSEGTVKAQCNAIYRKAGVSGRAQLLSVFIEDLMGEGEVALQAGNAATV